MRETADNGTATAPKGNEATRFKAGNPGRRAGCKNKTGQELVNDILKTYKSLGGTAWLKALARKDPKTFSRLLERMIPKNIELSGSVTMTADEYILGLMRRRREAKSEATD